MSTEITDISQLNPDGVYSYADYLTWKFTELIKGKLVQMAAPKTRHQRILWQLARAFVFYFNGKSCKAFLAQFDVRLYDQKKSPKADKDIFTVIRPDLCVICNPNKQIKEVVWVQPDLIIKILSDGNSKREIQTKYVLYEEADVLEYWIADPQHESI